MSDNDPAFVGKNKYYPSIERCYTDQEAQEELDKLYSRVAIGSIEYSAGYIVRHLDEPRFNAFIADRTWWECGRCGEKHEASYDADACCTHWTDRGYDAEDFGIEEEE